MDFNEAKQKLAGVVAQDTRDETPTQQEAQEETAQQQQLAQQEAQRQQQQPQQNAQQGTQQGVQQNAQQGMFNVQQQQMAQLQQQMGALMERNKQLEQLITQQSEQQEKATEEDMTAPPVFDWDGMEFEDEETRRQKFSEYQTAHDDYLKQSLLRELEPTLKYAREAQQEQEQTNAISQLKREPKFEDIESYMPKIKQVMKAAPQFFTGEDTAVDLLNGYLIAKGIAAIETPQRERTPEELVKAVMSNPDAAALIEQQRIAKLENNQDVPTMSASMGAGNAALNTQSRPKDFKESKNMLQRLLGLK